MSQQSSERFSGRVIRDVGRISNFAVVISGMIAGTADSVFFALARKLQWTTFDRELLFGSFISGSIGPSVWWTGFGLHLAFSSGVAFAYGILARSARRTGVGFGIHLGLFHWVIAGFVSGVGSLLFPFPGFFAMSYGLASAILFLAAHLIFGAVIGAVFHHTSIVRRATEPIYMPNFQDTIARHRILSVDQAP